MEQRLIPFNGLIALMTGDGGWPSPLPDAGFKLAGLEWPVTTSEGSVVVDGLGIDDRRLEVLVAECKGGQNIKPEQARKYAAMTAEDVARQLTAAASARSIQPVFVCIEGTEDESVKVSTPSDCRCPSPPAIVVGMERRSSSAPSLR